jgi:hypothetical protein
MQKGGCRRGDAEGWMQKGGCKRSKDNNQSGTAATGTTTSEYSVSYMMYRLLVPLLVLQYSTTTATTTILHL